MDDELRDQLEILCLWKFADVSTLSLSGVFVNGGRGVAGLPSLPTYILLSCVFKYE